MILIALAAAAASITQACPVGARIIGAYAKDVPLYDATNTIADHIVPKKGVVDPPLVIAGCAGRDFFLRYNGRVLSVPRMDVSIDQRIAPPICPSTANGGMEMDASKQGMRATDPTGCVKATDVKAKP
jgi:hypothetical protein